MTCGPAASLERPCRRLGITGYVGLVREGYDELVKAIIRPPRAEYSLELCEPCARRGARGARPPGCQ